MRSIIFRAWRKETGMSKPFTLGNLQDRDQFDFNNGGYLGDNEFGLENKKTTVMEYTGLNDKNGKMIFEGDVLNGCAGIFTRKMIPPFEVQWSDGGAYWMVRGRSGLPCLLHQLNDIEIIGNKFEHTALLKGTV